MSTLSQRHKQVDETGVGLCSVPQWWGWGGDAGFCGEPAYGPRKPTEYFTRHNGSQRAADGGYAGYATGLCCPKHSGPTKEEAAITTAKGERT